MPDVTPHSLFILDTNVLINDPNAMFKFNEHDVVITMTVLEELDKIKDARNGRYEMVNRDARMAIQNIKSIMNGASYEKLKEGVPINPADNKLGKLCFFNELAIINKEADDLVGGLPIEVQDNKIIMAALSLQKSSDDRVVMVTADVNMQIKSRICGVKHVEDYKHEQQIEDIDYLSAGYAALSDSFWDTLTEVDTFREDGCNFYVVKRKQVEDAIVAEKFGGLHRNMYLLDHAKEQVLIVFNLTQDHVELRSKSLAQLMNREAQGIQPRNIPQAIALDALLDPDITLVELTGAAGSGKTLLALAAAMEQCLTEGKNGGRYNTIMVTRTPTDMTESIGFLPGTEEEKMQPWLDAFNDSMEVLYAPEADPGNEERTGMTQRHSAMTTINMMKERVNMQFKSPNFFRGRSLQGVFGILDESQNMTSHQVKSMITRLGKGSKMVILGNLSQIDNMRYITPRNSGLTHAVEKMKNFSGNAVACLPGGERSEVSAYAEENM